MRRRALRARRGFTLVELLVVIVIIGILAAVSLPSFIGAEDNSRNVSVQANLDSVCTGIAIYKEDTDGIPPSQLMQLISTSGLPYLPGNALPISPWCNTSQWQDIPISGTLVGAAAAAGGTTLTSDHTVVGTGMIPPSQPVGSNGQKIGTKKAYGPVAIMQYGAIAYDFDAGSDSCVLYAIGKRGKNAIVADSKNL